METTTNQITGDAFANTCTHQSLGDLPPVQPSSPQAANLVGAASSDRPIQPCPTIVVEDFLDLAEKTHERIDTACTHIRKAVELIGMDRAFSPRIAPHIQDTAECIATIKRDVCKYLALISSNQRHLYKADIDAGKSIHFLNLANMYTHQIEDAFQQIPVIRTELGEFTGHDKDCAEERIYSAEYALIQLKAFFTLLCRELAREYGICYSIGPLNIS